MSVTIEETSLRDKFPFGLLHSYEQFQYIYFRENNAIIQMFFWCGSFDEIAVGVKCELCAFKDGVQYFHMEGKLADMDDLDYFSDEWQDCLWEFAPITMTQTLYELYQSGHVNADDS